MNMNRREFMKAGAMATAGIVASSKDVISSPNQQKSMLGVEGSERSRKTARDLLNGQYKDVKKLQKKEKDIYDLFGDFYEEYRAGGLLWELKELEDKITDQLDRGERVEAKNIKNILLGNSKEKEMADTVVEALNTKDGVITAEILEKILQDTFPKNWVNSEVRIICQNNFDQLITYKGVKTNMLALCDRSAKDRAKIDFYKCAENSTGATIIKALVHELAHANDWLGDNAMTALERVNLILAVYRRLEAPDRLRSSYVESIKEDKQVENNYYKTREYWAEICERYFTNYKELSLTDFKLVDDFVKKSDPDFNIKKAKAIRESITPGLGTRKRKVADSELPDINKKVTRMVDYKMNDRRFTILIEPVSEDDSQFELASKEFMERSGYEVA